MRLLLGPHVSARGLTLFALVVAVASFFGFSTIRKNAIETAERAAKEQVSKLLAEGEINAKLKREIEKYIETEADKLFADISLATAFPQDAGTSPIAERYPKGGSDAGQGSS